jgi:hypothetical protein
MSGGGSKTQTVGYWYKYLQAFALSLGRLDAVLEFRAGGRTAWRGIVTQTSRIYVNALNLWGGQKKEGGLLGYMDLQMGDADQQPNDYLAAQLGSDQPSYRGKAMAIWRGGRWGAMNPYPKRAEFKVRRILQGWDNDTPWYPEKAEIVLVPELALIDDLAFPATSASLGPYAGVTINSGFSANDQLIVSKPAGLTYKAWSYWDDDNEPAALGRPWSNGFWVTDDQGATTQYWSGQDPAKRYVTPEQADSAYRYDYVVLSGSTSYTFWLYDTPVSDNRGGLSLRVWKGGVVAMNPAHVLYDSLTARDMQGEPTALINDASFRAAADTLYEEGFGVCTTYDFDEDIEDFQQRILDVIGGALTQSREDGQYYLDLIRRTDDPESLPVIESDDIKSLTLEPSAITEQVNELVVEWYDVENNVKKSTPPMQSRGAVHAAGQVISETIKYPEIPVESLALRVQARDLAARATPLTKGTLTTNRRNDIWRLRKGQKVRLQAPEDGVADMIVVLGDIDYGNVKDGQIKMKVVEDVYSMPETTYVESQPSQTPPLYTPPAAPPAQRLIEAPYVEVVANLSAADLAVYPDDTGVIMSMATEPSSGLDYTLYTAQEGGELTETSTGEWCPSALIVEAAGYIDTSFTLTAASRLDLVEVGSWALWDEEIVRVDAIDEEALTITLGRGCADTVPWQHDANSRIWFCGDWASTDGAQYLDGETVSAALLTRTTIDELPLTNATVLTVELDQRHYRPYPPAGLLIGGVAYPEEVLGDVAFTWVARDRVMQSDQLFDTSAAAIGPEAGVTYNVRCYVNDTLDTELLDTSSTSFTWTPSTTAGVGQVAVSSVRGGLESLQALTAEFSLGEPLESDPHWESVVSLLRFDEPAGSPDFIDETGRLWSVSGSEISRVTSAPGFGTALSVRGNSSGLSTARGVLQTGEPFTIESYVRVPSITRAGGLVTHALATQAANKGGGDQFISITSGKLRFGRGASVGAGSFDVSGTTTITLDEFVHWAVSFDGTVARGFLAGNLEFEFACQGWVNAAGPFYIGLNKNGSYAPTGSDADFDEVRITQECRYIDAFTPASLPFLNQ